jgi:hypothetical protein
LELLVQPGDEKASKTPKLFIFLKKFLVCLFPINIHNFKPNKAILAKKQGKMLGNRQNQNLFRKTDKVKTFV